MKFLCRRELGSLRPVNDMGEEELRKLKIGDIVTVEVRKPRNAKHHALYWALLSKVWENLDHRLYPTVENLHDAIKFAAGIRETFVYPVTGEVVEKVGSISFEKMDQTAFSAFYDNVCDIIATHFLPGVTSAELKAEVESMIGLASPAVAAE